MTHKTKLSKGILEMKFMKRTRDKVIKEEDDAESRTMYSSEITDKMLHDNSKYLIEPSYVQVENLIEGRISFRGMNPEIERILELEMQAKQAKESTGNIKQEQDITDRQMANYFKKFNKKR